jgi:hypothetical protein
VLIDALINIDIPLGNDGNVRVLIDLFADVNVVAAFRVAWLC